MPPPQIPSLPHPHRLTSPCLSLLIPSTLSPVSSLTHLFPHKFLPLHVSSLARLFPHVSFPSRVSPLTRLIRHASLPSHVPSLTWLIPHVSCLFPGVHNTPSLLRCPMLSPPLDYHQHNTLSPLSTPSISPLTPPPILDKINSHLFF